MNYLLLLTKVITKFLLIYVFLLFIFLSTLVLSSLIPSSLLKQHVINSIQPLKQEGIYPSIGLPFRKIVLDNFTDSLILNTAYSINSTYPLKSALIDIRYEGNTNSTNQIQNLSKIMNNKETHPVLYERYWHGYLVFLRPLLLIFDYQEIRILISLLLYIGALVLIVLLAKKTNIKTAFAFLIGFITIDFFYLGNSIQFSQVFLIGIATSLYLLKYTKKIDMSILFFIVGSLTAFFDLLTVPVVTLGMILIIVMQLDRKSLKQILFYSLSWSVGYISIWSSKWIIVEKLFIPGAISTAFHEITHRTVSQVDGQFSHLSVFKINFFQLIGYDKTDKIIVLMINAIFVLICFRYGSMNLKKVQKMISYILIACIPYAWYLVIANHSFVHVWYTYRDQFISVVCFMLVGLEILDNRKLKKDFLWLRSKFSPKPTL